MSLLKGLSILFIFSKNELLALLILRIVLLISPLLFLIVFLWVLSLFYMMSLLKGLLILFIFSKNQLLDLLILSIVSLVSMLFISALILLFPSFYSLWAVFVVVPPTLVDVEWGCLFKMFLSFLGRCVWLWTSLSGLPLLCSISFWLLGVHFHLFPGSFWFLP